MSDPAASRPVLHLVSTADSRYCPGLAVMLATTLAAASGRCDYHVHVLDGGLTDADWAFLTSRLDAVAAMRGVGLALSRVAPDPKLLGELPIRRGSPLTFARLVAPRLVRVDTFVYVDSDVLCFAGVEAFREGLDHPSRPAIVAVRDPLRTIARDRSASALVPRARRAAPYFNAGIIGVAADQWRREPEATRIQELLGRAQGFRLVDQTLLNVVFDGRWLEIPGANNTVLTLRNGGLLPHATERLNLHYVGRQKPWLNLPEPLHRLVANRLFDLAWQWLGGPRHLRALDMESVKVGLFKLRLYKRLRPTRAGEYTRAFEAMASADAFAHKLWERFGPGRPLALPAADAAADLDSGAMDALNQDSLDIRRL